MEKEKIYYIDLTNLNGIHFATEKSPLNAKNKKKVKNRKNNKIK